MRVVDLIEKKRDGGTHSRDELEALIGGYVRDEVPDYQIAAWLMAVCWRGMQAAERFLVDGTNGENAVFAEGRSRAEAWHRACEQAAAVGMLAPPRTLTHERR